MLREAQLDQVLVTGSKASQFFRPFCPQGSDPPTTYSLLFKEQTPGKQRQEWAKAAWLLYLKSFHVRETTVDLSRGLTCIAAVCPELWHLNPLISVWIVCLPTAQLIRMSIWTSNHIELTLCAYKWKKSLDGMSTIHFNTYILMLVPLWNYRDVQLKVTYYARL